MPDYINRETLVAALNEAQVEFPETATVVQLRRLYDEAEIIANADHANREEIQLQPDINVICNEIEDHQQNDEKVEQLNRQIEIVQKQIELNRLKATMNEIENRRFDFAELEAMMDKFNGEDTYDIQKWFSELEDAFGVLECSERHKLVSTRRLLDGTAKIFLRTIAAHTYAELKDELISEFGKNYTLHEVFQQLKNRKLGEKESTKRYVIEMQEIASFAAIPEADVIDSIIDGLNDKSNNVAILYGARNIKELKQLMERYEKRRVQASEMETNVIAKINVIEQNFEKMNAGQPNGTKMKALAENAKPAIDLALVRCYKCLEMGHYKSSCLAPNQPAGACYMCSEVGHQFLECLKRKRTGTAAMNDMSNMTGQLDALQLVSVAFESRDKCIEVKRVSLFDSGSPISFIRKSEVPIKIDENQKMTNYFGMGSGNIKPCGQIKGTITFHGVSATHELIVVPDKQSVSPLVIGRDLLDKLRIGLCQFKIRYSSCELLRLNKTSPWNYETVNALMSFNLFKSPNKLGVIEAPELNKNSHNVSSVHNEQSAQKCYAHDVSSVNVKLSSSVRTDDVLSGVQIELKSQIIDGKVNDLKELKPCPSVNDELNVDIDKLLSESKAKNV